jgi:hypothetical protein
MCTVLLPPGVNPIAVNTYTNINIKIKEKDEEYSDDDEDNNNGDDDDDDEKEQHNDMHITTIHVVTQYVITINLYDKSCLGYSLFPGFEALTLGNWFPGSNTT